MDTEPKETLFRDIDADDEDNVTTVESFCVACHENVSMAWSRYRPALFYDNFFPGKLY